MNKRFSITTELCCILTQMLLKRSWAPEAVPFSAFLGLPSLGCLFWKQGTPCWRLPGMRCQHGKLRLRFPVEERDFTAKRVLHDNITYKLLTRTQFNEMFLNQWGKNKTPLQSLGRTLFLAQITNRLKGHTNQLPTKRWVKIHHLAKVEMILVSVTTFINHLSLLGHEVNKLQIWDFKIQNNCFITFNIR